MVLICVLSFDILYKTKRKPEVVTLPFKYESPTSDLNPMSGIKAYIFCRFRGTILHFD